MMYHAKSGRQIDPGRMWTAEDLADVQRAYQAVYGGLDERQTFRIDQMCRMFRMAKIAYQALAEAERGADRGGSLGMAGVIAGQFDIHRRILQDEYRCDEDALCERLEATSKWLKERGWFGLPEVDGADGAIHSKTAAGMCADMKRCLAVYREMVKAGRETQTDSTGRAK